VYDEGGGRPPRKEGSWEGGPKKREGRHTERKDEKKAKGTFGDSVRVFEWGKEGAGQFISNKEVVSMLPNGRKKGGTFNALGGGEGVHIGSKKGVRGAKGNFWLESRKVGPNKNKSFKENLVGWEGGERETVSRKRRGRHGGKACLGGNMTRTILGGNRYLETEKGKKEL